MKNYKKWFRDTHWYMLLAAVLVASCTSQPQEPTPKQVLSGVPPVYDYPINNPYAATIITSPPGTGVDYSKLPKPREKKLVLFPGRPVPEGFWYDDGLKYAELLQSRPAPLVYIIGGTGADDLAHTTLEVANIVYAAGFSVVLLPSTTHPNFIINASENFTPGRPSQDAKDMYRVINAIDRQVSASSQVTGRMIVGYSLGGLNALFTAKYAGDQGMNFSKVLLINPPLSLYSSMQVIDHMLYRALPEGIDDAGGFVKTAVYRLSSVSQTSDALDFSNERLLIETYNKYPPDDDSLATTIGLSFRLSAADMIFTADVMGHDGYIFPKDREFRTSTSLNDYMAVALRTSFKNYFDQIYTGHYQRSDPGVTVRSLIAEGNMETLAGYIASHPEIGLITNKDDIILARGELGRLVRLFGTRATVFPNGGHLGNLGQPAVGYRIVQFLRQ